MGPTAPAPEGDRGLRLDATVFDIGSPETLWETIPEGFLFCEAIPKIEFRVWVTGFDIMALSIEAGLITRFRYQFAK
jgi:hypothetical protein